MRRRTAFFPTLLAALALIMAAGCSKPASVPSTHDFEPGQPIQAWSTSRTFTADGDSVLGMFNDENPNYHSGAVLSLDGIPASAGLDVTLQLYLVGGWESGGKNADSFTISAGGENLVELTTFPCKLRRGDEEKPVDNQGTVDTGKRILGYWVVPLKFSVPSRLIEDGQVAIEFRGDLSGSGTEFWGLDDVEVRLSMGSPVSMGGPR